MAEYCRNNKQLEELANNLAETLKRVVEKLVDIASQYGLEDEVDN